MSTVEVAGIRDGEVAPLWSRSVTVSEKAEMHSEEALMGDAKGLSGKL